MESTNTIWMGNINNNMTERDIIKIFDSYKERINDINIFYKARHNNGYAFIEFDSHQIAKKVLQKYNGLYKYGTYLQLNWGKDNTKYTKKTNKVYTLYISNIDENVDDDELFDYFKEKYDSVKSAFVVYNQVTDESRGFGFLNVLNYIDFLDILRNNKPFYLRNRKLVIKRAYHQNYNDDKDDTENSLSYGGNNNQYFINNLSGKFNKTSPPLYSLMPFFSSRNINNNILANHLLTSLMDNKIKTELDNIKPNNEKSPELNSNSNLSTVGDEEQKANSINSNNENKILNEKEHLNFLLKTGTERISLYYNTINSIGKKPSLACHYYCNLTNDVFEQRSKEYLNEIDNKINDIYDNFVEDEDTK